MIAYGHVDMTIPPPSILSNYVENDDDFITDPDQFRDLLPQPFRMLTKIVDFTFDIAWDEIVRREEERIAEESRYKPPKFECQIQLPDDIIGNAYCLASSDDGEFIFIGLPDGVAVVNAISHQIVAKYEDTQAAVTSIDVSCLDDESYVASTLDESGTAKLLTFTNDSIVLAKVMNEVDTGTAIACHVSSKSDYFGMTLENASSGDIWLEVHKLPKDIWIKEINPLKDQSTKQTKFEEPSPAPEEQSPIPDAPPESEQGGSRPATPTAESAPSHDAKSQSQQSVKFTAPTIALKVRAPQPIRPSTASSPFNALKVIDSSADVAGTGVNHIVSTAHMEGRNAVFQSLHRDLIPCLPVEEPAIVSTPTFHFIAATRASPQGMDGTKPTGVLVHWSGRNQLMQYSLVKPAKDLEHKSEQVWPFPHPITASAVSPCSLLLAVGLRNGSLAIWDMFSGLLRRTARVNQDKPVTHVHFLDPAICPQETQAYPPYHTQTASFVLALCADGELSYVETGMGDYSTPIVVVPSGERQLPCSVQPLTGMPELILSTYDDGSVYLEDVIRRMKICQIVLPESHEMARLLPAAGGRGRTLYFKGVAKVDAVQQEETSLGDTPLEPTQDVYQTEVKEPEVPPASIFVLQTLKFPVLDAYWQRHREPTPFLLYTTLDKRLDLLMQDRIHSQPVRQARLQAHWGELAGTLERLRQAREAGKAPRTAESRYGESTASSCPNSDRSTPNPRRVVTYAQ